MTRESPIEVEATGETVGEARWLALRQLERLLPGLDRAEVSFEVVSEGERGLLGVGRAPARVRARAVRRRSGRAERATPLAGLVQEVLERIAGAVGADCALDLREDEASLTASLTGPGAALLIGRHGRTIDAIRVVVTAIAHRAQLQPRKTVLVDVGSYCARREQRLTRLARRAAVRAERSGEAVRLPPMTVSERRIVHLALAGWGGIQTFSEGDEPLRRVVVAPAGE